MMIECLMIGKDRCITVIKVDPRKGKFTYNKGLYTIPKEAVNLTEFVNGKIESYPELIFFENDPLPINDASGDVNSVLKRTVLDNALQQVAKAETGFMGIVKEYMQHPSKILILAFVGVIVAALIGGLISP